MQIENVSVVDEVMEFELVEAIDQDADNQAAAASCGLSCS